MEYVGDMANVDIEDPITVLSLKSFVCSSIFAFSTPTYLSYLGEKCINSSTGNDYSNVA